MAKQRKPRAPNGAASVYQGKDGRWHGRVTMGVRDDGRPDRRHVNARTQAEVRRKVRALEKARDDGTARRTGRAWTVEQWLAHWLDNIVAPFVRENTLAGYRVAVRVHLVPGVGAHRLDRLEPEHLERLYVRMVKNGSAPGTAHQAHRTIRTALNEAVRRGHISRNPATFARAPQPNSPEIVPYTVEEVRRILTAAQSRRNSARWAVALALGLRQGEALGLRWSDLGLDAGTLSVRRGRQRPRYAHGCGGTCRHNGAGYCPERKPLRDDTAGTKSRNGRRDIGLPGELVSLLRQHRNEQDRERDKAAQLWKDGGWVFASPTGQPLNPSTDYHEWKRLLRAAGVRDGGCTTPGIPPPRSCSSWACRNGSSWALWAGRTAPSPAGTSTSLRQSGSIWHSGSTTCCGPTTVREKETKGQPAPQCRHSSAVGHEAPGHVAGRFVQARLPHGLVRCRRRRSPLQGDPLRRALSPRTTDGRSLWCASLPMEDQTLSLV
jgi:integrase